MYIVEIRRDNDAIAGPMTQMRTWLDAKGIQASVFRLSLMAEETIFRVEFVLAREAAAFARALGGNVAKVPDDHPVAA